MMQLMILDPEINSGDKPEVCMYKYASSKMKCLVLGHCENSKKCTATKKHCLHLVLNA